MKLSVLKLLTFSVIIGTFSTLSFAMSLADYQTYQMAHSTRVAAKVLRLLDDPEFIKLNPEYKKLALKSKSSIRVSLHHDLAKLYKAEYNKVLASNYHTNYRHLDPENPKRIEIAGAINGVNSKDDKIMDKALTAFSSDPNERKLLSRLITVADYDDVYMARGFEFGEVEGRPETKVKTASSWIKKHSEINQTEAKEMLKISKFIESHPEKFTDIYENINSNILKKKELLTTRHSLLNKAQKTQKKWSSVIPKTLSGLKVIGQISPIIVPAIVAKDYIEDPVNSKPVEKLIEVITGTSTSLSNCQTSICVSFRNQCQKLNLNEGSCVEHFLKKPIHEQEFLRRDPDLNQILNKYIQSIVNIRCEKVENSKWAINFSFFDKKNNLRNQKMTLNPDGDLEKIETLNSTPETNIVIGLYSGQKISTYSLKYYDPRTETFQIKHITKNMGTDPKFFTSHEILKQTQQIHQAEKILFFQKNNIHQCCENSSCISYFENHQPHQNKTPSISFKTIQ